MIQATADLRPLADESAESMCNDPADVKGSAGLLALMHLLRDSARVYRSETAFAAALGFSGPAPCTERCEVLFFEVYADLAKRMGLTLNRITFRSIFEGRIPPELDRLKPEELAAHYVFNPWRGWRRVYAHGSHTATE